jgi:hypothetical protein
LPNCQAPLTGGQILDELNQANPLYGFSIGVIQVDEAQEKGDYVGVGRAGMDIMTTVVMTAITLKAGGGKKSGVRVGGNAAPRQLELPFQPPEPLTRGTLVSNAGSVSLQSGVEGAARTMPKGAPGFDIVTRTHVEGHAAATMRTSGLNKATLYINNPKICASCTRHLPKMLPSGSQLKIVLPDGSHVSFSGGTL